MNEMDTFLKENEGLIRLGIRKLFATFHLAEKVAIRHNMDYEDLIQIGRVALWKSKQNFDESLGYKFSSYAVKNIKFTIMTELRLRGHLIHVPAQQDIKKFPRHYVPGDSVTDDNGDTLFSLIGSGYDLEGEVMEKVHHLEMRKKLQLILSEMTLKERNIVILRVQGKSFREIASRYGVSHQAISAKYKVTLERLKKKVSHHAKREEVG
jgi:RNA polymerase sigma factor (sigma-70 family)